MNEKYTYSDGNRLNAAWRGRGEVAKKAGDAEPVLVVSDPLWLEVMPKALYPQHRPLPCRAVPKHPIEET